MKKFLLLILILIGGYILINNQLGNTNSALQNKIIFDNQTNKLNVLDATTKKITPLLFGFENENGHFGGYQISSDKKRLLMFYSQNSYIGSSDGSSYKKIDIDKIKRGLNGDYEIGVSKFSTDSKYVVLIARDMIKIRNIPYGEGGDFRKSTNKVLALNIETSEVKELYSADSSPVVVDLYNPSKNILGFGEYRKNYHLLNLATKQEETLKKIWRPTLNYQQNEYYTLEDSDNGQKQPKSLAIYSIYDSKNKLGRIEVDNPASEVFAFDPVWSPDYKYFALWLLDEQSRTEKLRIYTRSGVEVRTIQDKFDYEGIFSQNGDSFLYELNSDYVKGENVRWKSIEVKPGGQEMQVDIPSKYSLRNFPIFWFRESRFKLL